MTADTSGDDLEAQARRYWRAWSEALGQSGEPTAPATDPTGAGGVVGWRKMLDWWLTQLPDSRASTVQETFERFSRHTGDWFGAMQEVAARFAGRDAPSADVALAWREAVEGQGERMLQWTLGATGEGSAAGGDPWLQQIARLIERWHRDSAPWLDMPTFGLGRNQQMRWQELARAQQEYQECAQAYAAQLKTAIDQAFGLFEAKLADRERAGNPLNSARAMFDLWIEAAEEAYSVVALSVEFQRIYGAFANAQLRLRAQVQREVEQISERLGMPTRSEMDAAHRRIAELERRIRRMAEGGTPDANEPRPPEPPRSSSKSKRSAQGKSTARSPSRKATAGKVSPPRGRNR